MSASTVSATANPRRRTSTAPKQSLDFLSHDPQIPAAAATTNDKLPAGDPLTNDAILEQNAPKKPPTSHRNRRTAAMPSSKHPKPRWKTILSIAMKNLMLLVVILGLLQMVRKLAAKSVIGGDSMLGFGDMEGRIAAVESSMKTTAKMLQVQVEVVDKKIETEVGNLRREVGKRVEAEFDVRFSELVAKSEGLETAVEELKAVSAGFVRKEDVMKMYDEWRSEGGGSGVSLDEIRGLAREVVEKEIEKHAADGLGRVDYALGSGGARVVRHSEPYVVGKLGWLGSKMKDVDGNAEKMLKPSFGEPGMCFALKGNAGFVIIKLRDAIVPEAITLEHVAKSVAYDRSSAPKDCRVFGWLQGHQSLETDVIPDSEKIQLSVFSYDLEKSNAQTFDVIHSARSAFIDTVRFEFSSNHGSETHTCIYRLRVHGQESKLAQAAES